MDTRHDCKIPMPNRNGETRIDFPPGWIEKEYQQSSLQSFVIRSYYPDDDLRTELVSLQSLSPLGLSTAKAIDNLFLLPAHDLSEDEVSSMSGVLGDAVDPEAFEMRSVRSCIWNKQACLLMVGLWLYLEKQGVHLITTQ